MRTRRRSHFYLLSNRAGRDVKRDNSWLVAPAISLARGTGVGVNRHSSRLLLVCLEGGGGGIMMGWKALSTSPSQLQSELPVLE